MSYVDAIHSALEKKRLRDAEEKFIQSLKQDIMENVKDQVDHFLSDDAFVGQKGLLLLALRKRSWGRQRALSLLDDIDATEQSFIKPLPGQPDNSIEWADVFETVKEEYGIDLLERYGLK